MGVLSYRDPVTGAMVPLLGGGISQTEADARYLRLTGGTVTGGVNVFANAAARDAAIPAPALGMTCFLTGTGTGTMQRHNGFVWVGDEAETVVTGINGWDASAQGRVRMDHQGIVHLSLTATVTGNTSAYFADLGAKYSPEVLGGYFPALLGESGAFKACRVLISDAGIVSIFQGYAVLGGVTDVSIAASYRGKFLAVR